MHSQNNEDKESNLNTAEMKKNRLILDLKILSSLNNKPSENVNTIFRQKNIPEIDKENTKIEQSNSIFSPLKGNLENDIHTLNNFNTNNYTNLTYYHEPYIFENSHENTIMSFKYANTDIHKTNESFLLNLLQPIKHDTNEFISLKRISENDIYQDKAFISNIEKDDLNNLKNENQENIKSENKKGNMILFKTKKGKKLLNKYSYYLKEKEIFKFKCEHKGCDRAFSTKKLLSSHHKKFIPQCHSDTINLLELIGKAKNIIKNKNLINNLDIIKAKFNKIMKNISLDEHAQIITGLTFN